MVALRALADAVGAASDTTVSQSSQLIENDLLLLLFELLIVLLCSRAVSVSFNNRKYRNKYFDPFLQLSSSFHGIVSEIVTVSLSMFIDNSATKLFRCYLSFVVCGISFVVSDSCDV